MAARSDLHATRIEERYAALQEIRMVDQRRKDGETTYEQVAQASNSNAIAHVAAFIQSGDDAHLDIARIEVRRWIGPRRAARFISKVQTTVLDGVPIDEVLVAPSPDDEQVHGSDVQSVLRRFGRTQTLPTGWDQPGWTWDRGRLRKS